jgi:hypothetical protein
LFQKWSNLEPNETTVKKFKCEFLAKYKEKINKLTQDIEAEESVTNESCTLENNDQTGAIVDLRKKVPVKLNNHINERTDSETTDEKETDQSLKLNETRESFCHIQSLFNNEIHEFLKTKGRSKNDVHRLCEIKKNKFTYRGKYFFYKQ